MSARNGACRFLWHAVGVALVAAMVFVFGATFLYAVPQAVKGDRFAQAISVVFGGFGVASAAVQATLLTLAGLRRRIQTRPTPQVADVLDRLNAMQLSDFWIDAFGEPEAGANVLVIRAGANRTPAVIVRFLQTELIACPTEFRLARFRLASKREATQVRSQFPYQSELFAVDAASDGAVERTYFIGAGRIEVERDHAA